MAPESTTWASIDRKLNIDFEYGQNFEVWGRIYREIVSYVGYDEMADFGEKRSISRIPPTLETS